MNELYENFFLAEKILGSDFISPITAMKKLNFDYSPEQIVSLNNIMPDVDELIKFRVEGFTLMPRPSSDFYPINFSCVQAGGWLAFRKSPIVNSFGKDLAGQQELILSGERIPTTAEIAYCLIMYFDCYCKYLLSDCFVRSANTDEGGENYIMGFFSKRGVLSYQFLNSTKHENTGIITVRDFS